MLTFTEEMQQDHQLPRRQQMEQVLTYQEELLQVLTFQEEMLLTWPSANFCRCRDPFIGA